MTSILKQLREKIYRNEQLQSQKFVKDSQMNNTIVDQNTKKLFKNYAKTNTQDNDSDIDIYTANPLVISENNPATQQQKQIIDVSGIDSLKNSMEMQIPMIGQIINQKPIIISNEQQQQSKKGRYSSAIFTNNYQELQNSQIFDEQDWIKIQQILEDQTLFNLHEYKNFQKKIILQQGKYTTTQPFKSILFFGLDQFINNTEKGKQLVQFLIYNELDILLNDNIQSILKQHATIGDDQAQIITQQQELQIKKLFLQFYIQNTDESKSSLEYVEQYPILEAILQIVVYNFICNELYQTDKLQRFSEQYSLQDGDPQIIFQTFCFVFGLTMNKINQTNPTTYSIANDENKFNIQVEKDNYTSYIFNGQVSNLN